MLYCSKMYLFCFGLEYALWAKSREQLGDIFLQPNLLLPMSRHRNRGCIDRKHDKATQLCRALGLCGKSDSIAGSFWLLSPFDLEIVLAGKLGGKFLDGKLVASKKWVERMEFMDVACCPLCPCVFVEATQ